MGSHLNRLRWTTVEKVAKLLVSIAAAVAELLGALRC
jgi:hypothetical protein